MSGVTEQLLSWKEGFNRLSPLLRRLVTFAFIVLLMTLLDRFLIQSLTGEIESLTNAIEKTRVETRSYSAQLLDLQKQLGIDPSLSEDEQSVVLTDELGKLADQIEQVTSQFVKPEQMTSFIYESLARSKALTLDSLEKLPIESIVVDGNTTLYKHGVKIVLQGKYADAVGYMQQLEKMTWRVFWQAVALDANYPLSHVELELYTLSLDPRWMVL